MNVTFFHRKPIPNCHFSVEIIFRDLREALPTEVCTKVVVSRFFSKGLLPRICNAIEAFMKRGPVNHVTGDINYVGIFLPKSTTIHTILDCVFMQNSRGIKRYLLRMFWLRIPVQRSRFITTISEASKSEILRHTHCNPDKIKVIPIALSPTYNRVNHEERTYEWKNPRILLVGATPNKNIPRILEAIKDIPCRLIVVGKLSQEAKEFLEANNVNYSNVSGLNVGQMYEKYRSADILVFASTYEGFGMPIIEAQSTGVPVVTSNISSMPEVAGPGGALLVDPYNINSIRDGVLSIIRDQELRESLIAKGLSNVKRFEAGAVARMYMDLYKQI